MYGTQTQAAAAAGSGVALTGLNAGAWALTVIGLTFVAVALWALVRRHSKNRP